MLIFDIVKQKIIAMKKNVLIFFLVFTVILGCEQKAKVEPEPETQIKPDEEEKEPEEKGEESGKEESGEIEKYIEIQDGVFRSGNMKFDDTSEMFVSLSGNETILRGGSNPLTLTTTQEISKIFISIEGFEGHLEKKLDSESLRRKADIETVISLLVSSELPMESFKIWLAVEGTDGKVSNKKGIELSALENTATGTLQVSVSWDQLNDVDLHLVLPGGKVVFYGNRYILKEGADEKFNYENIIELMFELMETGVDFDGLTEAEIFESLGMDVEEFYKSRLVYLDVDSNAACFIDGINNENISFPNDVPNGKYKVNINLWDNCNVLTKTNYIVSTRFNGQIIKTTVGVNPSSGTLKASEANQLSREGDIKIMEFEISGKSLRRVMSPGVEVIKEESYNYLNAKYEVQPMLENQLLNMFSSFKKQK